jgi:molybdopterin-guanine dinucleotide biosynthesis protein B
LKSFSNKKAYYLRMIEPVIIGFYGYSKSGKTKLISELLSYFSKENYNIACIKQTNKFYDVDKKGKDTYRFASEGSNVIVFLTKKQTSFVNNKEMKIKEVIEYLIKYGNLDLIFIEGAKDYFIPKIRIGEKPLIENTILDYNNDINTVISIINKRLNKRLDKMNDKIELKVNGKLIPLTEFPNIFIKNTLFGMIKSLKGIKSDEDIRDININYKK